MTHRVEKKKWILYRHTKNFNLINAVAVNLKNYCKTSISNEERTKLLLKLKTLDFYRERNPEMPLDAINHRINTLAYYMFGYKDKIEGQHRFMFSPLGNLFLKHIGEKEKISKVFLTMLWSLQFEHPHGGIDSMYQLFPFRLVFKLLTDERLDRKLYAFEMEYLVMFVENIDNNSYERLVDEILNLRTMTDEQIKSKFMQDSHAYVNAAHEWDYYVSYLLESAGLLNVHVGKVICRLQHGKTKTFRRVSRNYVTIKNNVYQYCSNLLSLYDFTEKPIRLDDAERLKIDVVKEIYGFYPQILLEEIGEVADVFQTKLLELPKLIERYSNNNNGEEAYLFEDILLEGFNMFYNVEAKGIGGAGNTDIECLYLNKKKKFAVDAKSTANKLSNINAGRLRAHRDKIGGEYTIVVTPRYVPAVMQDIKGTPIVIIRASTFSEYLYNHIYNNIREIDYEDFDSIIRDNLGKDISLLISNKTIEKFAACN